MRRKPAVMSLFLSAALVASCGGDKSKVAAPSTTTPVIDTTTTIVAETTTTAAVTTTAAPVTAAVAATDQSAKAKAATLQPSDFPTGFAAVPEADGGGLQIEQLWTELMACLGVPKGTSTGVGTSPTIKRGLATQARSTVEYTSDASAAAVAAAIGGPKFQKCATDAFVADLKRSKPEGSEPGPVAVTASKAAPIAPKSSTFRINATVLLGDLTVSLFQDFYVIFKGGAVIRAVFLNPGSEFPQDLERTVLGKVIGRT